MREFIVLQADIVIPTFNGMEYLPRVINAIRAQDVPFGYGVTCIDSCSTDGTHEWLRGQEGIRLETCFDFQHGRTRNYGASLGSAEYIVFLTQDAIPKNDQWLYNLVAVMTHYSQAAGGFGRHEAHLEHPEEKDKIANVFKIFDEHPLCVSKETRPERWNDSSDVGWKRFMHFFSDNNSCLRRSVWEKFPYPEVDFGEDQAWADMIIRKGYSKVYIPTACVYHSHRFTPEQEANRREIEMKFYRSYFGYE